MFKLGSIVILLTMLLRGSQQ